MKLNREIENILNEQDIEEKYSLIYDYIYDYAKRQFIDNNYCDFKDGTCIANRLGKSIHLDNGCCYQYKKGLCNYLSQNGCAIKCLPCQLYMCKYLEDKFKKLKIEKIFPIKKVFNLRQQGILKNSYFKDKGEVIKKLLELR